MFSQHGVDVLVVEGLAVVALEEQRRAVLTKACVEEGGDLFAVFVRADQGLKR